MLSTTAILLAPLCLCIARPAHGMHTLCMQGIKINIIDTPGHADFGGEVERVLNMCDGKPLTGHPLGWTGGRPCCSCGHINVITARADSVTADVTYHLSLVTEMSVFCPYVSNAPAEHKTIIRTLHLRFSCRGIHTSKEPPSILSMVLSCDISWDSL